MFISLLQWDLRRFQSSVQCGLRLFIIVARAPVKFHVVYAALRVCSTVSFVCTMTTPSKRRFVTSASAQTCNTSASESHKDLLGVATTCPKQHHVMQTNVCRLRHRVGAALLISKWLPLLRVRHAHSKRRWTSGQAVAAASDDVATRVLHKLTATFKS